MKILVIGKPTYNIVLTQDKYLVEGSKNLLKEKYQLEINQKKLLIDKIEKTNYFGYTLIKNNNQIEFVKKSRNKEKT